MKLVSVYEAVDADLILYELLKERLDEPHTNISHRDLPTWEEHVAFIASQPYDGWYLVKVGDAYTGAAYISKQDEIGVALFKSWRGHALGAQVIALVMQAHPRERYLANINPANARSISVFEGLGFTHIQNTYEWSK